MTLRHAYYALFYHGVVAILWWRCDDGLWPWP